MKDYPCRFGEGCKKKDVCSYVHPSEPNYQQSVQKKESQHGGSSSHRRFADVTASNTIAMPEGVNRWGKNASSPGKAGGVRRSSGSESASTAWNFSGQSTSNRRSSNGGVSTETTAGFGNPVWGSTDNNNASTSNDTGWGITGDSTWANDDTALGWGATTTTRENGGGTNSSGGHTDGGGWGPTTPKGNETWGTNNSGGYNVGGGWGSPTPQVKGGWEASSPGGQTAGGGWGSTTDIAKTPDQANFNNAGPSSSRAQHQSTTSSWGSLESGRDKSGDAHKDKGEDIQMRDPSPRRKQDEPKFKSVQPIPLSPSRHPAESPAQMPLSPKYAAPLSAVSTKLPADLKSLALEVAKPKGNLMKIKGAEARRALYQSTIKHTKNAIISYIEHQEAQTDLNRWKDTQMSSIYGHATQKTRKILDSERATFHRRLQDVEDTFQKEVNALVNLPELPTTNKRKSNELTKEVVAEYMTELQDWFKDLELHKRLLMEEETEEGEVAEEKEEGEVNDPEEEDNPAQRISELLRCGQWTWKELTEVIEAMESRYDAIQTNFYFDVFTTIGDDSKERLILASKSLEVIEREEIRDDALPAVSEKIAIVGKNLVQQSMGLATLLSEVAELEKKLDAVRRQTTQASLVCQLVDRLCGDFEQWKEDDNAQLTAITEQVKRLHLYQPSAPSTSGSQNSSVVTAAAPPVPSTTSQSAPISTSDLIDPIRQLVVDAIHKELKLCFENLRFRCMENQQKLETEMEEEAKKIIFKAEIVKNRISPSRESSIRPVISRSPSNIPLVAHSRTPV